jgi:hypothetical protein
MVKKEERNEITANIEGSSDVENDVKIEGELEGRTDYKVSI